MTSVSIWSEGTRLAGDLFVPKNVKPGERRPALLLCHGWGGLKNHLSTAYAERFCNEEGYVVLTFDYRGWGESDSRFIRLSAGPNVTSAGPVTLDVHAVREVVDPVEQALDVRNCLDFLAGEEHVDPERIGLWGSSYGGGMVVWTAAHDRRVKAVVAQVGSFGIPDDPTTIAAFDERGRQRARGDLDVPIAQGIDQIEGLNGTPDYAKFRDYNVWRVAPRVRAATMVIDVDNEEYVDVNEHGKAITEIIGQNAPVAYHPFSGSHYEIYEGLRKEATDLAIEWYASHLRG